MGSGPMPSSPRLPSRLGEATWGRQSDNWAEQKQMALGLAKANGTAARATRTGIPSTSMVGVAGASTVSTRERVEGSETAVFLHGPRGNRFGEPWMRQHRSRGRVTGMVEIESCHTRRGYLGRCS